MPGKAKHPDHSRSLFVASGIKRECTRSTAMDSTIFTCLTILRSPFLGTPSSTEALHRSMQHTHSTDLLSGYLDRELGPVETFRVECQLASCRRCQEIYAMYQRLNIRLRRAFLCVEAPEYLAERIRILSRN